MVVPQYYRENVTSLREQHWLWYVELKRSTINPLANSSTSSNIKNLREMRALSSKSAGWCSAP